MIKNNMTQEEINILIKKSRLCGRVFEVETYNRDGRSSEIIVSYYINVKDNEYVLYIPNNVNSLGNPYNNIRSIIRPGSRIKVIGGRDLQAVGMMFKGLNIKELDLTQALFRDRIFSAPHMFCNCTAEKITGAKFDISRATNASYISGMFRNAKLGDTDLTIIMNDIFKHKNNISNKIMDINIFKSLSCKSLNIEIVHKEIHRKKRVIQELSQSDIEELYNPNCIIMDLKTVNAPNGIYCSDERISSIITGWKK